MLAPCTTCHRHVRRSERACPFCGQLVALDAPPTMRVVTERIGRAAIFSIGAAAITSMGGCGAKTELRVPVPLATDAGPMLHDAGQFLSSYGGPAPIDDAGAPSTHYGGPPHDAGHDVGATLAAYGGPALRHDAGADVDMGCSNADYGGPPCR